MDRWEAAIEDYHRLQTLDTFSKVLLAAEWNLKHDLAPFEFDWFVQTLLSKPVSLLDIISSRATYRSDVWSKAVHDAFKLLRTLVEEYHDQVEHYIEDIVKECTKPFDARTRTHALGCLCVCVRYSLYIHPASYITELAQASACKAPLALLVGAICEHHPESVCDQINTIWRQFLILLGSNKNTDSVCKALLTGVWGLFKNFGDDLPMREVSEFYDKLTREYMPQCEGVAISILRDYAPLFREKLSSDVALRDALWKMDDLTTLTPVYAQVARVVLPEQLQKILDTEIAPKTGSNNPKLRFTALKVVTSLHQTHHIRVENLLSTVDVYALEFELRSKPTYEVAEAVAWCIESNMANSEKLLQTAIVSYDRLPATLRKGVVVTGLLNAAVEVMHITLNFLITESCREENSLATYLPVWRDLFESPIIDKKQILFEKYVENFLVVVENFLEDPNEDKIFPEKLDLLLYLTSHVFTLQPVEDFTRDQSALVSAKLLQLAERGLPASVAAVARALTPHGADTTIYQMFRIDNCTDAALLCESCLALIHGPEDAARCDVTLKAFEVIFSRKDAEPKTLSLAIEKFEKLLLKQRDSLDRSLVSKCIQLVDNLRSRKDMVGKDARILHRNVIIFLGKYFNLDVIDGAVNNEDNMLIVKLKDILILNVPNPIEGTNIKLNLGSLLQLAISREHEQSLRMLQNIICANLCTNNSPVLQMALGRVIVSLCRAKAGDSRPKVARLAAATFCGVDATLYIIEQIGVETSPSARWMLCEVIESILLHQPGSEANERLLTATLERVSAMMGGHSPLQKVAASDIVGALTPALKLNSGVMRSALPSLLVTTSQAAPLFIDNLGLFSESTIDYTVSELLNNVVKYPLSEGISNFKNSVKWFLNVAQKVAETSDIIQKILSLEVGGSDYVKVLYLWSQMPSYFELSEAKVKEILDFENCSILESMFQNMDVMEDVFKMETHLRFINQYAAVLLKSYCPETLKHICDIIENIQPKFVWGLRNQLSECITHIRQTLLSTPDCLIKSLEIWTESLPIKEVSEHIHKERFVTKHAVDINALKLMLDIFKLRNPILLTTLSIFAKNWPTVILSIYAKGHFKYLKKEVPFLADLLTVALVFLNVAQIKKILQEGHNVKGVENERVGLEFCRFFMPVFIKYLVKNPYLLLQDGMEDCCVLLNDVVKWSIRKRWGDEQLESVIELVDLLWPIYEPRASFKSKHSLLLDMSCLTVKLSASSRPLGWVTALLTSQGATCEQKIALVTVLPGGEEYSETYKRYASMVPTRLSDMNGTSRAALRALLDALAGSGDRALLHILVTLADGEDRAGWWDAALASCMASLACEPSVNLSLLSDTYNICRQSSAATTRLLVPLLRYSPSSLVEKFFASILKESFEGLTKGLKPASTHPEYRHCVAQRTTILNVLMVLFEKVPPSKIESPSSSLYELIQTDSPWHVARQLMIICSKLRDKLVAPVAATAPLSRVCREFQCAAYRCMCACVCARRPSDVTAKVYDAIFDVTVWGRIVDDTHVYELPLKTEWNRQTLILPASLGGVAPSTRRISTHTRVFLRTLSENPLHYDLIEHGDDTDIEEVELSACSLNEHPCAVSLTAVIRQAASAAHCSWRDAVCSALNTAGDNTRYLLAQVVCNCKEELKPHARFLRPALLAVIVHGLERDKHMLLNSLHVDIMNTLVHWREDTPEHCPGLNTAITCLVQTALVNCTRNNLYRMLESVLDNVLKSYGCVEGDLDVFEKNFGDPNRTKYCLKLLLRFARYKIRIPNLLTFLLTKLSEYKTYKRDITALSELIGIVLKDSAEENSAAIAKLKRILEDVKRNNNISDFVNILYHSGCCDTQQFKIIVDLTQKLPEAERKKCLHIISTYRLLHPTSVEVVAMPTSIVQMLDDVTGDKHFEDLFTPTGQSLSTKRQKLNVSSPVLDTIGGNEHYTSDVLSRLGTDRIARLNNKLSGDNMCVRFVECFYVCVYLPIKYPSDVVHLCVCLSSFLETYLSHLRNLNSFKDKKLRDEPWIIEDAVEMGMPSKTRTKRMVGTLRSYSYTRRRNDNTDTEPEIDVQVSIENILDTFLQFAKISPPACMELVTQLLRSLGRGFDSRRVLARLLSDTVTAAPDLIILARECVDELCTIDGFNKTIDDLKNSNIGSEAEPIIRLLHEEAYLRRGMEYFVLGKQYKEEDVTMSDGATEFSIEGLVSTFQKLSNWDELTIQEKREMQSSGLQLWTDRDRFRLLLDRYTADTTGWFGQMVQLYRGAHAQSMKWLRALDRYPRRRYAVAAVVEAMQWHSFQCDIDCDIQLSCDINKNDCLAEWAARLMLRTAFITDKYETEQAMRLSRSYELQWCSSANERSLYSSALACVQRNCLHSDLYEDETLQWMEQKLFASTAIALAVNDMSALRSSLEVADNLSDFYKHSTPEAVIGVNNIIMQLSHKTESLTEPKIQSIMDVVEGQVNRLDTKGITSIGYKKNLKQLYETAAMYFDGLWEDDKSKHDAILVSISDIVGRLSDYNIDGVSVAAVLVNRLDECGVISDVTATTILHKLSPIIESLPPCFAEALVAKRALFPAHLIKQSKIAELQGDSSVEDLKKCLQLLCQADHLLLQYCEDLYQTLESNDKSKWIEIFERMQNRVFKNEFAGPDYQALAKYDKTLHTIRDADTEMKRLFLKGITQELRSLAVRPTLRLSHACPALSNLDPTRGAQLGKLLRLPAHVVVTSIQEELSVFSDSVRRPCVVRVVTSRGARRFLLKNEDLRAEAAVSATMPLGTTYTVLPLSLDCGLIQFLEEHVRLRDMIAATSDIDDLAIARQAGKDHELVLPPRAISTHNYSELCDKVPAHALRSAIESRSASIQDFISKKRRFTETLSEMTIGTWLFGLGDRHLQNILYNTCDGGVVAIDWGALFQYGSVELPPARLTRNLLAVCDVKALESRLQGVLSSLRESRAMFLATLKLCFRWMPHFQRQLIYIENILQGKMAAPDVTKDALMKSNKTHNAKYIELLDTVFEGQLRDIYSIEEQISALLLASTEPWILSVTRSGWEPWL